MTELLEALHRGDDETVAQLLAKQPQLNVFEAAALGKSDRLRAILAEEPASANDYGDDGFQPLPLACFYGHVEAARILLEHGADPSIAQGGSEFRAIDAARMDGDERLEQLLS